MSAMKATACVECGTTAGYIPKGQNRPVRRQGYCHQCYWQHWNHGTMTTDPAKFAPVYPDHETMLWHKPNGERQRHAISPACAGKYGAAHDAQWESACAEWLRRHPEQTAHFDHPEYAAFPSPERRRAA